MAIRRSYTITQACGHEVTTSIYGNDHSRRRIAISIAQKSCAACEAKSKPVAVIAPDDLPPKIRELLARRSST